jgi:hypothetical protein
LNGISKKKTGAHRVPVSNKINARINAWMNTTPEDIAADDVQPGIYFIYFTIKAAFIVGCRVHTYAYVAFLRIVVFHDPFEAISGDLTEAFSATAV